MLALSQLEKCLCAVLLAFQAGHAAAQSATDLAVLKGLAPATVLPATPEGTAVLSANYTLTGGIQTGAITQATLLPLVEQRQQALQDVFITWGNVAQLADGLGTTLGAAYVARAHYLDRTRFTSISAATADLISYTLSTTSSHAGVAKYFFANGTVDGRVPAAPDALALIPAPGGQTDFYGRSYHLPAGAQGADPYGNSRPFQTEPAVAPVTGRDYLNTPADNGVYNRGPLMTLTDSPSYPSGHATYGYAGALLLAILVPSRYPQLVSRAAEYGNDRILFGSHYAMDVIGGRTLAAYDLAHLLANDPVWLGRKLSGAPAIRDYRAAVPAARADVTAVLQAACGKTLAECAVEDTGRFSNAAANDAFYADTQTYGLPVVYPATAAVVEDVGRLAPEAGNLLTAAFPSLSLEQADDILTETEGPGGGFLDDGSAFGVYSRLNLRAAALRAATLAAGDGRFVARHGARMRQPDHAKQ